LAGLAWVEALAVYGYVLHGAARIVEAADCVAECRPGAFYVGGPFSACDTSLGFGYCFHYALQVRLSVLYACVVELGGTGLAYLFGYRLRSCH
jgi:hypothetical protein